MDSATNGSTCRRKKEASLDRDCRTRKVSHLPPIVPKSSPVLGPAKRGSCARQFHTTAASLGHRSAASHLAPTPPGVSLSRPTARLWSGRRDAPCLIDRRIKE